MQKILTEMNSKKLLRNIDIYFASHVAESFCVPEAELLFALVFKATESGNTCLDTSRPDIFDFYSDYKEEIDKAVSREMTHGLISKGVIAEAPDVNAPFIMTGTSLYMKSFYTDEKSVSDFIHSRAVCSVSTAGEKLMRLLDKNFPENSMRKAAALNAALNSLSVISGGPGTGKTTTVFSLTALLCELADKPLKIAVCAPTGKAASRLTEAIAEKREASAETSVLKQIPEKAFTIHRLLGITGDSAKPFYNKENKLPYDILIVDEASMVDVQLMAKLTDAVKRECRLILMGDKDQLASVQPGAVLGDICAKASVDEFSAERAELLEKVSGRKLVSGGDCFADITVMLDESFRFKTDAGIGLLAQSAGCGDWKTAMDVLRNDTTGVVSFIEMDSSFEESISSYVTEHFENYIHKDPAEALEMFAGFRILTPHKKQEGGAEHINAIAHRALFRKGYTDNTRVFYHGMPVMITANDYSQNLFNGETGLIYGQGANCRAHFPADAGKTRQFNPGRLPEFVKAFSMTVHKSQGSEFKHVLFVLPETESAVLTRELFYTAVTRAREKLTVISTEKAVKACISRRTERTSGISG